MRKDEMKLISNYCREKGVVTSEELKSFILSNFPDRKEENFSFYVFDLKRSNIIYQLQKNIFKYSINKHDFIIETEGLLNDIMKVLYNDYSQINMCIWQTSIVYDYMNLQPFKNYVIVEVDRFSIDNIYEKLKKGFDNVLPKYIFDKNKQLEFNDNLILVSNFIKESPIEKKPNRSKVGHNKYYSSRPIFPSPKIEKILVDLYCDKSLMMFEKHGELKNIYENILKLFKVNFTTLLRYAKVRNVSEEIQKYLKSELFFDITKGEFY